MPLVIHLLLLFGSVLAHDEHMDQDLKGKGLLSAGGDTYLPFGRVEENTEKLIEVDVTKEYGVELAKDYAVDVTKGYGVEVNNERDENIIEMEVFIMESEDAEGDIDGLRMEVFNEVVLEELLQV